MPLVVEISVAFSILIAFIVIGIFLFRSASASIRWMSPHSTIPGRTAMNLLFDPVAAVLLIPIGSAALLAVLPGHVAAR